MDKQSTYDPQERFGFRGFERLSPNQWGDRVVINRSLLADNESRFQVDLPGQFSQVHQSIWLLDENDNSADFFIIGDLILGSRGCAK